MSVSKQHDSGFCNYFGETKKSLRGRDFFPLKFLYILVNISHYICLLRSTLGERFVIFGDPVVDGIPVHARREDSRFLVTWTGDVQNLRHFE